MKTDILYMDTVVIGVNKPAGVPCQQDLTGDRDLTVMLAEELGIAKSELYLIHRLDRPVGGVILYCRDKKAAACLTEQMQNHTIKKQYRAVVCGNPPGAGRMEDYLLKNQRLNTSKVAAKNTPGAKIARLDYRKLGVHTVSQPPLSLVEIQLITGRHHQIRVQMAAAGYPLWGDTKYNPLFRYQREFVHIALYAGKISFVHPVTGQPLEIKGPEPKQHPFSLDFTTQDI